MSEKKSSKVVEAKKNPSYVPAKALIGPTKNPANPSGRRGKFSGTFLVLVEPSAKNPRKPDTFGYRSYEILRLAKKPVSYEDYRTAGGRDNDLGYDIDKLRIRVTFEGKDVTSRFIGYGPEGFKLRRAALEVEKAEAIAKNADRKTGTVPATPTGEIRKARVVRISA